MVLRVVLKVTSQCSHPLRCSWSMERVCAETSSSINSSSSARNSVQVTSHQPSFYGSSGLVVRATEAALATTAILQQERLIRAFRLFLPWKVHPRHAIRKRSEIHAAGPGSSCAKFRLVLPGRSSARDWDSSRQDPGGRCLLRSQYRRRSKPSSRCAACAAASGTHSPRCEPARYKTCYSPGTDPASRKPLETHPELHPARLLGFA